MKRFSLKKRHIALFGTLLLIVAMPERAAQIWGVVTTSVSDLVDLDAHSPAE